MEKLPTFEYTESEYARYLPRTISNEIAIKAINKYLLCVAERVNELIERDSQFDLNAFKVSFLTELNNLLAEVSESNTGETETIESRLDAVELQLQVLKEKVAKLQSTVGIQKPKNLANIFDLLV
ncbi:MULTISPECIES: hypothetical protein [unclassified Microcoleus]|uniref:hypothetical protein n=1 Tax=unclassified Microcoleus TaxID=2642155 RepID=UPI002FD7966B